MKNNILHLVWAYIKRNIRNYIIDFISYSVFVIVAIAVIAIAFSFSKSYNQNVDNTYGTYSGYFTNITDEIQKDLQENPSVLNVTDFYTVGIFNTENSSNPYIAIGKLDEMAQETTSLKLIDGRMPIEPNEAVLEESVKYQLAEFIDENGCLNITYVDFAGVQHSTTFYIVGTLENYTVNQNIEDIHEGEIGPFNMLSGIIVNDTSDNNNEIQNVFVTLSHDTDIAKFFKSFAKKYSGVEYLVNTGRLSNESEHFVFGFKIILGFVAVLGFLCLFGNIITRKKRNIEHAIMLKCCGASNSYLICFRLISSAIILLPSILVGVILGGLLTYVISAFLLVSIIEYFKLYFSVAILAIACVITVVTVLILSLISELHVCNSRPLASVPYKKSATSNLRIKNKFFKKHPFAVWAANSVYLNSSKYTFTIIGISVMMLVVILMQMMITQTVDDYNKEILYDYKIDFSTEEFMAALQIPVAITSGFGDNEIETLNSSNELSSCFGYVRNRFHICIDTDKQDIPINFPYDTVGNVIPVSPEEIERALKEYGYHDNEKLFDTSIIGCNEALIDELLKYSDGSSENYDKSNQVIIFQNEENYYKVGDTVYFTQPLINSDGRTVRKDIEFTVGAVVNPDESSAIYSLNDESDNGFFILQSTLADKGVMGGYTSLILSLKDKSVFKETENTLKQYKIIYKNNSIRILSNREYNNERAGLIESVLAIGGIITLLIMLFCIINLYSLFRNKIYDQRKTWGILRSGGVTKQKAFVYNLTEIIIINIISWIVALVTIISMILVSGDSITELLSFWFVLIIPFVSIIICYLVVCIIINRFWREKIISMLQ